MDLKYFGDILLHKILRKNLPGRVSGDHLYFTKDDNDRYSLFTNDKDGSLKECTYNGELAKQIDVLSTNALQYKGVFDGDLNTLYGIEKQGVYSLSNNCTNTPDDTIRYVFERAILTVKSDGIVVTHSLITTHVGYPFYVGKEYNKTGFGTSITWSNWKCNDDKITDLQNRNFIQAYDSNSLERDIPTVPTDYIYQMKLMGLKNRTSMGLTGGGYVHPIGINSWTDESANTYELMFSHDGLYYRKSNSPTEWETTKKLATTDKIDISCTPETGYAIEVQNNYLVNNVVYYNLDVKRIDGSDIPINQQISVAIMPEGMSPKHWAYGYGGTRNNGVTGEPATIAFYSDRKIYATCKSNGKILGISGVIVL